MLIDADDGEPVVRLDRGLAAGTQELVSGRDDPEVLSAVVDCVLLVPGDQDLLGAVRRAALATACPERVTQADGAVSTVEGVRRAIGVDQIDSRSAFAAA